ncbi:HAD superfamily hydrolase (TIGR01549 family) [Paenibacillus shirakamiensis]|uniref:HAD superfamily hydrolase (TIGR01549 family) n=1 Tax=Paenibacillus shirakamiensis TaxID=1265935 RepID=A0ABS4JFW4_9BACL|nr:HAD family hydrolase [Paenibacillus shirakamiensis]MBP2000599.1 HAD superfamily hydrolase (TIGR01549 family) [Paenibacillus shirakamiensis]
MYNTIIFDVDGTLIDTERAVIGSLQKMLIADYSRHMEADELNFVLGIPGADSLPKLGIADIHLANERWNFFMKDFLISIEVFDEVEEVLRTLQRRQISQGIVTSKTKTELRDDFEPMGLSKYLTHTVCADDTELHKPHPEPLLKFLRISGTPAHQAIYIGDTIYDYQCARDAGVHFGLASWGCRQPEGIQADHIFQTPMDILRII